MAHVSPKGERADDAMRDSVARFDRRRRRWKAEGPRALAVALAVIGIGWMIAIPAVVGFAVGHWLDRRFETGVAFAAGLGALGLALGCYSAWRRIADSHGD